MGLPKEIADLIERFDRNLETYKSGQYNEAQLRQDFLNPFFGAFGWDMANKAGYAEAYREVIHEDAIKIGGATKAPDYCFRIGSAKKFFVEAKKPAVNLKDDISPAFQLRRYAWSAKLPLSILTDFEEFVVYDCRIKPVQTDKASTGRILYFTYKDYAEKWDELVSIFSRDAVLKGSFDKYAESSKLKKGTATVDDAFLTEIEDWRDLLARNIAIRNPDLSQRELNFAVQRTIDRIVFLRICEDRGIEEYGRLQMQLNGTNVYKRLLQLFSQTDDRYNSGLFHFQREKERHEEPDKLTPNISASRIPGEKVSSKAFDSIREFIFEDIGTSLASFNFVHTKFMSRSGRPLHGVAIHFDSKRRNIVGYVQLFGILRFSVLIAQTIPWKIDMADIKYCVDPVNGYEVPLVFLLTLPDVKSEDCLRPQQTTHFVHSEISEGLKNLRTYCNNMGEAQVEFIE